MYNKVGMSLIYFYDSTKLDKSQITDNLRDSDHDWRFIDESIHINNIDPETEVLSPFVTSNVTREIIEKLPKLKLIACRSTGFNNVDLEAAEERNITVVNVPRYGESTVAEYAFILIGSLLRKIPQSIGADLSEQPSLVGSDLHGKILGVIGTGNIGQHAIKIAKGFGMKVIASDPYENKSIEQSLGFSYTTLENLMSQSDVITIHAPYLPATHHLINRDRLALMKQSAIIVNTARGEIIDTASLVDALSGNKIAGAALDVVEGETLLNKENEAKILNADVLDEEELRYGMEISLLRKMPNVILTPHNAFNTVEAIGRINKTTAENIKQFWYGEVPNKVNVPKKKTGSLILMRHTESEWNASGQWSGTRDVHLSEKGFHEASLLGIMLKKMHIHIDRAFCSEQIRTRETLSAVLSSSQQFDTPVERSPAINERDYGDYTGKNKWQMKEQLGEELFNSVRRGWDVSIPNGESLKTVYERVVPFYLNTIVPLLNEGENVLLVAHGNSLRSLMKYIESINDEDISHLEMLFNSIVHYQVDEDGLKVEKTTNEIGSPPPNA